MILGWRYQRFRAQRPNGLDADLLARVGLSNHAVERFAHRAGLATDHRTLVEPIILDLLGTEGRLVSDRPSWAYSHNHADLYLQIGEWMLLPAQRDRRTRHRFTVVTVISGDERMTWARAHQMGYVVAAPPGELVLPRRRWRWGLVSSRRATRRGFAD